MRNIKVTCAYDGTSYHGFQEQRGTGLGTVQEEIEKALQGLSGSPIRVIGAGRTDAGVHARGQVVNFTTQSWNIPVDKIALALNGVLPRDIAVLEASQESAVFHARFSAKAKTYCYSIQNARLPDPFLRRYSYFVPRHLDTDAMAAAGEILVGSHDFASFKAEGTPVKSTERKIFSLGLVVTEELVKIYVRGNGFLYNMVRIIAGTLLEVGLKKYPPQHVEDILLGRNRVLAGPTVPPQGLCLMSVEY